MLFPARQPVAGTLTSRTTVLSAERTCIAGNSLHPGADDLISLLRRRAALGLAACCDACACSRSQFHVCAEEDEQEGEPHQEGGPQLDCMHCSYWATTEQDDCAG